MGAQDRIFFEAGRLHSPRDHAKRRDRRKRPNSGFDEDARLTAKDIGKPCAGKRLRVRDAKRLPEVAE